MPRPRQAAGLRYALRTVLLGYAGMPDNTFVDLFDVTLAGIPP